MAPNQHPTRVIPATDKPKAVAAGVEIKVKRSTARKETAMIELRVVRGGWPIPASRNLERHLAAAGMRVY